ncbi:hypothetical protein A9976_28260 [Delftia sp. UME58]|nr:hypothetical protein [Delftia sp. UME58]
MSCFALIASAVLVRQSRSWAATMLEAMNTPPPNTPGQVPTSSSRNRFATKRTMYIAAAIVAVVLVIMFAPW